MQSKAHQLPPPFMPKDFQYLAGVSELFNTPLLSVVVIDAPRCRARDCPWRLWREYKDTGLVVDAHCRRGVAIVPAVMGEAKELRRGEGEGGAIRGCAEFCFYSLFLPHHTFQFRQQTLGDTSVYCGRETTYRPASLAAWI